MKKKFLFVISVIVLIGSISTFLYFFLSPEHFSQKLSYANPFGGFSPYGLLRRGGDNDILYFYDFESSNEVVFCSKPQCQHKNKSCFAYSLIHELEAQNITLYDKDLYYTTYKYDFNTDYKWSITLHKSSTDGAMPQILATFKGYDLCDSIEIIDGYVFLSLRKYDATQEEVKSENERISAKVYAQVSVENSKIWYLPEKKGYNQGIDFIGVEQGKFYYLNCYNTKPIKVNNLSDAVTNVEFSKEFKSTLRVTLMEFDIQKHSESPFLDEFTEIKFDDIESIDFTISDSQMYAITYYYNETDRNSYAKLSSYDLKTKSLLLQRNPITNIYGNMNLARYRTIIYFAQYDDSGHVIDSKKIYDPLTNKVNDIINLKDYIIYPFGSIDDKIILVSPKSSHTLGNLSWIYYSDYLADNVANVHDFRKNIE